VLAWGTRVMAVLCVIALSGCASSGSPTATAAGLLSQTGATINGSAYTVTPEATNAPGTLCPLGAAEADGTMSLLEVSVCIFSSSAEREGFIRSGLPNSNAVPFGNSATFIDVGQTALIVVGLEAGGYTVQPPAGIVQSIASKTGGTVDATP